MNISGQGTAGFPQNSKRGRITVGTLSHSPVGGDWIMTIKNVRALQMKKASSVGVTWGSHWTPVLSNQGGELHKGIWTPFTRMPSNSLIVAVYPH